MSSIFWDLELSLSRCVPTMMTGEWGARACGNVEGGGVRVGSVRVSGVRVWSMGGGCGCEGVEV